MADIENILIYDDFFGDIVDTPREGIEQHKKWKCLKGVIGSGKPCLLGRKWTQEKVDKASDETMNKTCDEYKQSKLNEKGEKTAKALSTHVIKLYSTEMSRVVKIRDVKKLHQDTENDPMNKDQISNLGCLLACVLGDYLAPVLVAAHTVNNLDFGDEKDYENEGYESGWVGVSYVTSPKDG